MSSSVSQLFSNTCFLSWKKPTIGFEKLEEIQRIRNQFRERGKLGRQDKSRIDALLEEYRFHSVESLEERTFDYLLARVDKVPPSLALSQAALESA